MEELILIHYLLLEEGFKVQKKFVITIAMTVWNLIIGYFRLLYKGQLDEELLLEHANYHVVSTSLYGMQMY